MERKKTALCLSGIVGGTKGPDGAGDMVDVDIISNQYKKHISLRIKHKRTNIKETSPPPLHPHPPQQNCKILKYLETAVEIDDSFVPVRKNCRTFVVFYTVSLNVL